MLGGVRRARSIAGRRSSDVTWLGQKASAPALMACTVVGMSRCPVRNTMGKVDPSSKAIMELWSAQFRHAHMEEDAAQSTFAGQAIQAIAGPTNRSRPRNQPFSDDVLSPFGTQHRHRQHAQVPARVSPNALPNILPWVVHETDYRRRLLKGTGDFVERRIVRLIEWCLAPSRANSDEYR
jgi:hypothetical protein